MAEVQSGRGERGRPRCRVVEVRGGGRGAEGAAEVRGGGRGAQGAAEGQSEPTSRAGARHDKILPPLEASIEASQRLEAS